MNDERAADETVRDGRTAEGVSHLQAAAHEMIQAARAFLDVIEEFVEDDAKLSSVADAVTSMARGAAQTVQREPSPPDDDPAGGSSVQHIRVS